MFFYRAQLFRNILSRKHFQLKCWPMYRYPMIQWRWTREATGTGDIRFIRRWAFLGIMAIGTDVPRSSASPDALGQLVDFASPFFSWRLASGQRGRFAANRSSCHVSQQSVTIAVAVDVRGRENLCWYRASSAHVISMRFERVIKRTASWLHQSVASTRHAYKVWAKISNK